MSYFVAIKPNSIEAGITNSLLTELMADSEPARTCGGRLLRTTCVITILIPQIISNIKNTANRTAKMFFTKISPSKHTVVANMHIIMLLLDLIKRDNIPPIPKTLEFRDIIMLNIIIGAASLIIQSWPISTTIVNTMVADNSDTISKNRLEFLKTEPKVNLICLISDLS